MKIDPSRTNGAQLTSLRQAKGKQTGFHNPSGTSAAEAGGDRISVSEMASSVANALRGLASGNTQVSVADPARLAALRERIEAGTLKVDADALAEAILNTEN